VSHIKFAKVLSVTTFLMLLSCQGTKPEESLIVEAQNCLDKVGFQEGDAAQNCVAPLASLDSPQAYLLKCSALFIKYGFANPQRLILIAEQIENSGGSGTTGTAAAIGLLAFDGANAAADSQSVMDYCSKSGSKGMTIMASLASVATVINKLTGAIASACRTSPETCATAVAAEVCFADSQTMGEIAIVTYQTSCQSAELQNPMCAIYAQATQNGQETDPVVVGDRLQSEIKGSGGCP